MLSSVDEVIDAIGGTTAAASLAGVGLSAVSNWRTRGRIPPEKFMIFAEALKAVGKEAPVAIFGFADPAEARA